MDDPCNCVTDCVIDVSDVPVCDEPPLFAILCDCTSPAIFSACCLALSPAEDACASAACTTDFSSAAVFS